MGREIYAEQEEGWGEIKQITKARQDENTKESVICRSVSRGKEMPTSAVRLVTLLLLAFAVSGCGDADALKRANADKASAEKLVEEQRVAAAKATVEIAKLEAQLREARASADKPIADKQLAAANPPVQGDARPPEQQIKELQEQIWQAERMIADVTKNRHLLERWYSMSLGSDARKARNNYKRDLLDFMDSCGLQLVEFPPALPDTRSPIAHAGKNGMAPIYTGINYAVRFNTDLKTLVTFLMAFQQAPRMHRVKAFTIERADANNAGILRVEMMFEALVILDANLTRRTNINAELSRLAVIDAAAAMLKAPSGLGGAAAYFGPSGQFTSGLILPLQERRYADMAFKNIFGLPVAASSKGQSLPRRGGPAHQSHSTHLTRLECHEDQERMQHSLDELRAKKDECDKQVKAMEKEIKYLLALREWVEHAFSWLDELYDLTVRSPFEKGFRVTKVHAEPLMPEVKDESFRARARMTVCGVIAANQLQKRNVQFLIDLINKDAYCRCSYSQLKLVNPGEFEFALNVDLMRRAPQMYTTRLVLPIAQPTKKGKTRAVSFGEGLDHDILRVAM